MNAKSQYIKESGLQVGDKVKFHPRIIRRAKRGYENPSAQDLEIYGLEILKKNYERKIKTYTVVDFKNLNGSWNVEIDQKIVVGTTSVYPYQSLVKVK